MREQEAALVERQRQAERKAQQEHEQKMADLNAKFAELEREREEEKKKQEMTAQELEALRAKQELLDRQENERLHAL